MTRRNSQRAASVSTSISKATLGEGKRAYWNDACVAMAMQKSDYALIFDIKAGYTQFRLSPSMWDMFIFHFANKYYRCVDLQFCWDRLPLWFTRFLAPLPQHLRKYPIPRPRLFRRLTDFSERSGRVARKKVRRRARRAIHNVRTELGLTRHNNEGEWSGSTPVEHL